MNLKPLLIALGSIVALNACEQKNEEKKENTPINAPAANVPPPAPTPPPAAQPAAVAAQPGTAGQPMPAAGAPVAQAGAKEKAHVELQAKLDSLAAKVALWTEKMGTPAHKNNKKLKDHLASVHTKLEAVRADVKAVNDASEATWVDARTKAEKGLQELEVSLEQANTHANVN